jgi:Na+/H+ antiporter NhaD/arsenite permease-like protein
MPAAQGDGPKCCQGREDDVNHWAVPITWILFTLTYIGLAIGKIPGLRIDRAGIAFVGACLMLVTGVLSVDQAVSTDSIDFKSILLLFGMMVLVGVLRLSGLFEQLTDTALRYIRSPKGLLGATIGLSGILSAFLINDVICVALTPLVLGLARRLKFDPIPHLLGLATAANIGSTGTITGNPQNIYIGSHSGISYLRFTLRLFPVAMLGLVIAYVVICVIYRGRLNANGGLPEEKETGASNTRGRAPLVPEAKQRRSHARRSHRRVRQKAMIVTVITVALFFVGLPLELVALGAAAVVMLDGIKPAKIYGQVDWSLLLMFVGLFIVVHAFQVHVVSTWGIANWDWLLKRPVDWFSLVAAGLSNLVSNVPAVLLLEPLAQAVPEASRESAWLALAMSSTFAGNLTVLGSVANLIVVESAGREGVKISFWEYCKVGIPLTLLTLVLGIVWLQWVG